jgi:hypothetical protein
MLRIVLVATQCQNSFAALSGCETFVNFISRRPCRRAQSIRKKRLEISMSFRGMSQALHVSFECNSQQDLQIFAGQVRRQKSKKVEFSPTSAILELTKPFLPSIYVKHLVAQLPPSQEHETFVQVTEAFPTNRNTATEKTGFIAETEIYKSCSTRLPTAYAPL